MYTYGLLWKGQGLSQRSGDDQHQTFMEFLVKACKKFSPDLRIMHLFSMLKHIFGQSFFLRTFPFFPLSYAEFLAKGRECDSVVNPTFVLIGMMWTLLHRKRM